MEVRDSRLGEALFKGGKEHVYVYHFHHKEHEMIMYFICSFRNKTRQTLATLSG